MKHVFKTVALIAATAKMSFFHKMLLLIATIALYDGTQAQEFHEIFKSDNVTDNIIYTNDDECLALASNLLLYSSNRLLYKMKEDGTILDSTLVVCDDETLDSYGYSQIFLNRYRKPCIMRIGRTSSTETVRLYEINENLELHELGYNYSYEFQNIPNADKALHRVFCADNTLIFSYVDDGYTVAVKIDADGNLIGKQTFLNCERAGYYSNILLTPDSLGCRVIVGRAEGPLLLTYDCYTLDDKMNVVDIKQNLEPLSYPYVPINGYYRSNPNNGRIYSIGMAPQKIHGGVNLNFTDNIIMSVYDEDFNQLNWTRGILTETGNHAGEKLTIDFGPNNEVYMLGGMDKMPVFTKNLYVACFDEDLNKIGELYYKDPSRFQQYISLAACPQGGCLVSCQDMYTGIGYVYKVTMSDFLSVEEAHAHGFAVATAYPNPGGNTLNIQTALQNANVEVYDLIGRLVHSQAITENVTPIDACHWNKGTYVWKVFVNNPSTGERSEAETGKWIKE